MATDLVSRSALESVRGKAEELVRTIQWQAGEMKRMLRDNDDLRATMETLRRQNRALRVSVDRERSALEVLETRQTERDYVLGLERRENAALAAEKQREYLRVLHQVQESAEAKLMAAEAVIRTKEARIRGLESELEFYKESAQSRKLGGSSRDRSRAAESGSVL